jgi:hypothetical protein
MLWRCFVKPTSAQSHGCYRALLAHLCELDGVTPIVMTKVCGCARFDRDTRGNEFVGEDGAHPGRRISLASGALAHFFFSADKPWILAATGAKGGR